MMHFQMSMIESAEADSKLSRDLVILVFQACSQGTAAGVGDFNIKLFIEGWLMPYFAKYSCDSRALGPTF